MRFDQQKSECSGGSGLTNTTKALLRLLHDSYFSPC